jgi:putative transcriptional regulator
MKRINLINARKKLGLSQQQLADQLGIDRGHYAHIENGSRTPSLTIAMMLSYIFNKPIEAIFSDVFESIRRKTA